MADPKTYKSFRIDTATLDRVRVLADQDNRTVNNLVETILMWAVKRPGLLAEIKSARKRVGLGEILGEMHEVSKTLAKR